MGPGQGPGGTLTILLAFPYDQVPWSFLLLALFTLSLHAFVSSRGRFPLRVSAPKRGTAWTRLSGSPILGAAVCPVFSPFLQMQEELLGWKGDFQTSEMQNWKLEVPMGASKGSVHIPSSSDTREILL